MGAVMNQAMEKIIHALSNPEYVWRTVSGLEQETKLPKGQILQLLEEIPGGTLVSSRKRDGSRVYSTREHYRKTQSWYGKLVSALAGEIK